MMYSLMLPLPLYFMVIKRNKSVLVSALSFFTNRLSISARNCLALVTSSDTAPLNASGIPRFMIIRLMQFERSHFSKFALSPDELSSLGVVGRSILSARSRSIQPRTIYMFSFQSLKFVPLSIGIEFRLADIVATLAEKRTTTKNKINKQICSN
ncbi:uncharacterized protein M6B38_251070 [Iris pallida]|uniref:Uncharacterized protein n=1 Tax=Iris pallida TaxID=29817 RepID=A0AAX6IIL5_IRIPA|nr:uncharacterized protein M6B38_251070 [Iris pallida]